MNTPHIHTSESSYEHTAPLLSSGLVVDSNIELDVEVDAEKHVDMQSVFKPPKLSSYIVSFLAAVVSTTAPTYTLFLLSFRLMFDTEMKSNSTIVTISIPFVLILPLVLYIFICTRLSDVLCRKYLFYRLLEKGYLLKFKKVSIFKVWNLYLIAIYCIVTIAIAAMLGGTHYSDILIILAQTSSLAIFYKSNVFDFVDSTASLHNFLFIDHAEAGRYVEKLKVISEDRISLAIVRASLLYNNWMKLYWYRCRCSDVAQYIARAKFNIDGSFLQYVARPSLIKLPKVLEGAVEWNRGTNWALGYFKCMRVHRNTRDWQVCLLAMSGSWVVTIAACVLEVAVFYQVFVGLVG